MPLFICSYRLFEYLYIVQAGRKPVRGSSKSQRDDMNRIEESNARQYCPEYEALIDMNNELYTALPISDLFPHLVSLRVLDYYDPEELRGSGRTEREICQRFIEKHLCPYLELGDTSRLLDFIKAMKQLGKCNLLVERLEERIRFHRQGHGVSVSHSGR